VLVLNRKSSHLLEFNQKYNAAIFSSKCETFALQAGSGDSRMKKVGGALRGQGKSKGVNINIYLCRVIFHCFGD